MDDKNMRFEDDISCPACSEGCLLHPVAVFAAIQKIYGSSYYEHKRVHEIYMLWLSEGVLHSLHERVKEALNKNDADYGAVRQMVKTEIRNLLEPNLGNKNDGVVLSEDHQAEWGDFSQDIVLEVDDEAAEQAAAQEYWGDSSQIEGDPFSEFDERW